MMSNKYAKVVYLEPDLEVALKEIAGRMDRSVNWLINNTLKAYVKGQEKPQKKEVQRVVKRQVLEVPDFIDGDLWVSFMEVRKKLKAPDTENAHKLLIGKLEQMYKKGIDPNEAIRNSIENGWKGVFEPKGKAPIQHNVPLGDW